MAQEYRQHVTAAALTAIRLVLEAQAIRSNGAEEEARIAMEGAVLMSDEVNKVFVELRDALNKWPKSRAVSVISPAFISTGIH